MGNMVQNRCACSMVRTKTKHNMFGDGLVIETVGCTASYNRSIYTYTNDISLIKQIYTIYYNI